MTLNDEVKAAEVAEGSDRRAWVVPTVRHLIASDADNSTGIGPDAETVAS